MTDHDVIQLRSADPFADVAGQNLTDLGSGGAGVQRSSNLIHIRVQQRNGRKTLTTVQVGKSLFHFELIITLLFLRRVLGKSSTRNVSYVHSKRNLHVMVRSLTMMNMVK